MSDKTLLVVEDDADVRLGYNVLFRANHYNTIFAADALSAATEARKHLPDLIILDLGLPAGDGFVVLERFRANMNTALIPVIVVSARDPHGNREKALKAGARAFVHKPFNDVDLLALIRETLGDVRETDARPTHDDHRARR
jgi:DNA-binding response OmpR family regulator